MAVPSSLSERSLPTSFIVLWEGKIASVARILTSKRPPSALSSEKTRSLRQTARTTGAHPSLYACGNERVSGGDALALRGWLAHAPGRPGRTRRPRSRKRPLRAVCTLTNCWCGRTRRSSRASVWRGSGGRPLPRLPRRRRGGREGRDQQCSEEARMLGGSEKEETTNARRRRGARPKGSGGREKYRASDYTMSAKVCSMRRK